MIRKPRKTVGLIGLGIIGSRAAAGLRAAGYQTFVWNRTPQPVPNFLTSPAEVAGTADIIQIFVADAQALFDVLGAMRERLTSEHLIIASGTFGPEATVEASEFVQATGAHFLDAPFTGSKGAAEKCQLVYYVGGDDASFLRAKPVLEATSKAIVRIGAVGDAAIVKVVTNMIAAVSIQALAEALAIVRKAGLSDEVLGAALEQNACRSGTMELKLPKMLSADYEPHFSLKHMFKDVQLGIQMANALEIDVPATSVTAGAMFGGMKHGWADLDFSAIYKVYDDLRGRHHALEAPPAEHHEFVHPPPHAPAVEAGKQPPSEPSAPEPSPSTPVPASGDLSPSIPQPDAPAEPAAPVPPGVSEEPIPPAAATAAPEKPENSKRDAPPSARPGKPSKNRNAGKSDSKDVEETESSTNSETSAAKSETAVPDNTVH